MERNSAATQHNITKQNLYFLPRAIDETGMIITYKRSNDKVTIANVDTYIGNMLIPLKI